MSESKRSLEDIQKDYTQACAKLGQAQYQVKCIEGDIAALYTHLSDLNAEASALTKALAEAKAAEAAKVE